MTNLNSFLKCLSENTVSLELASSKDIEEAKALKSASLYGIHTSPSKISTMEYAIEEALKKNGFVIKTREKENKNSLLHQNREILSVVYFTKFYGTVWVFVREVATLKVETTFSDFPCVFRNLHNQVYAIQNKKDFGVY